VALFRGKLWAMPSIWLICPPIKDFNHQLSSLTGKVKLYVSNDNPEFLDITMMRPAMIAEAPVSDTFTCS